MTIIKIAFTVKPFKVFSLVPVTSANVFNPDVQKSSCTKILFSDLICKNTHRFGLQKSNAIHILGHKQQEKDCLEVETIAAWSYTK